MIRTDNFDRADANPIGGNWVTVTGEGALRIASNILKGSTAVSNAAYYNEDFSADHYSQVYIQLAGETVCPIVRVSPSADSYYGFRNMNLGSFELIKRVAGVNTSLHIYSVAPAIGQTLKLSAVGSSITFYIDGVAQSPVITDTDLTSGFTGIRIYGTAPSGDYWEGGDITSGNMVSFVWLAA